MQYFLIKECDIFKLYQSSVIKLLKNQTITSDYFIPIINNNKNIIEDDITKFFYIKKDGKILCMRNEFGCCSASTTNLCFFLYNK